MMFIILSVIVMLAAIIRLYFLSTKSEAITYKVERGYICYSCKSDIDTTEPEFSFNMVLRELDGEDDYILCKSCKRNDKLSILTSDTFNTKIEKLKLYAYRNNIIITKIGLTLMVVFLVSDWLIYFLIDIKLNMSAIYNTLYWGVTLFRQEMFYRKKPSE